MKIYSLYKGEKEIAFGTIEEIANKLGIKKKSVLFYQTPTYAKRGTGKNKKLLIRVEYS